MHAFVQVSQTIQMHFWNRLSLAIAIVLGILSIFQTDAAMRRKFKEEVAPPAPPGPKLKWASVKEEVCVSDGTREMYANYELDSYDFIRDKTWYVPLASKYFYYHLGEALIKRPLAEEELGKLCLTFVFKAPMKKGAKYTQAIAGYRQLAALTLTCVDNNFVKDDCKQIINDPKTNSKNTFADNVGTIIASDKSSFFVMIRCVMDKYRDWAIFSTNMKLSDHELTEFLPYLAIQLEYLGFNMTYKEMAKYDTCKFIKLKEN